MFIGANYKLTDWSRKQVGGGDYGWEYAKVIDIRANGLHIDVPGTGIKGRINRDIVVYFYDTKDKPNSVRRSLMEISEDDFLEDFGMEYSLTNIDGIKEQADCQMSQDEEDERDAAFQSFLTEAHEKEQADE